MSKIARLGLIVLGLVMILFGLAAATQNTSANRSAEIILLVIAALGAAMIATAVFGGDDMKVEGAHPAFEKLKLSITGPIAAFFLTLFLMLFYSQSATGPAPGPKPDPDPDTTPQMITVESYCSATNVYGYGQAANFDLAAQMAVNDCVFNGGFPDCCPRNIRQISTQ